MADQATAEIAVSPVKSSHLPLGMDNPASFHRSLVAANGAFRLVSQDIGIPARGWPLELRRTYRSDFDAATGFGTGWSWTFGSILHLGKADSEIRINETDGGFVSYRVTPDGTFRAPLGRGDWLVRTADGYERRFRDGRKERFDSDGRLLGRDGPGGGLTVTYEGRQVRRVATADGRSLVFEWDDDDRITAVVDPLGRRIVYGYTDGFLTSVTDALKRRATYRYDRHGMLVAAVFADHRPLSVVYDAFDRTKLLLGPGTLTTTFSYDSGSGEPGRTIVSTDGEGRASRIAMTLSESEAVLSATDGVGRRFSVTKSRTQSRVIAPDGKTATIDLDDAGNATSVRDFSGRTHDMRAIAAAAAPLRPQRPEPETDHRGFPKAIVVDGERLSLAYDDAGRLSQAQARGGRITRFEYDAGDRLVAHVGSTGGRTRYSYDNGDRLLFVQGPDNRNSRVSYTALGLPEEIFPETLPAVRFEYDKSGLPIAVSRGGRTTRLTYDAARQLTSVTDPFGNVTTFTYDALGRPSAASAAEGRGVTMSYDENGAVSVISSGKATATVSRPAVGIAEIRRSDELAERVTVTATGPDVRTLFRGREIGRLVRRWDGGIVRAEADGRVTSTRDHDERGRVAAAGPLGRKLTLTYGADDRLQVATSPTGSRWTFTHDAAGRLIGAAISTGDVFRFSYDESGNLAAVEDPRGVRSTISYDRLGRLVSESDDKGETRHEYGSDRHDPLRAISYPDGSRVAYGYDDRGRLISRTVSAGSVEQKWIYEYGPSGELASITHPDGTREDREFDDQGRLRAIRHAGRRTSFSYDAAGRVVEVDVAGRVMRFGYDALGRLTTRNGRTAFDYADDATQQPSSAYDPLGGRWPRQHDRYGAVVASSDPTGATIRYDWNDNGLLHALRDNEGRGVELGYDSNGRVSQYAIGADAVRYRYGARGELAAIERPSGAAVRFEHDRAGRPLARTLGGGDGARFSYDDAGRLRSAETPLGTARYQYGAAGELLAATDPFGRTLRYEYDSAGRRSAMVGPGGERIAYRYDAKTGLLAAVTASDGREIAVENDAAGRPTRFALADGAAVLALERDGEGQVSRIGLQQDGSAVLERSYQRDAAGNVLAIAQGGATSRFAYDAAHRLVRSETPGRPPESFAYDRSGNLTEMAGSDIAVDAAFRVSAFGDRPASHDADGYLAAFNDLRLEHDALGRVTRATRGDGPPVHYRYDHAGRLVERRQAERIVRFLYDGDQAIAAYDGAGRRIAWVDRVPASLGPLLVHSPEGVLLVATDEFGTPVGALARDGTGARHAYGPWGDRRGDADLVDGIIGFAGALQDHETGLVFMGARAYSVALGRFTAPDPAGLRGGSNPYAYAANNPLRFHDPSGLQTEGPYGAIGSRPPFARLPEIPGGISLAQGDRPAVGGRVYEELLRITQREAGSPGARVAADAARLVEENHVAIATWTDLRRIDPNAPASAFGAVMANQPHVANVTLDPRIKATAGWRDIRRQLAATAVHEIGHSNQLLGYRPMPRSLMEFESYLLGWAIDPRHVNERPLSLRQAVAHLLSRARHDPLWSAGYNVLVHGEQGRLILSNLHQSYGLAGRESVDAIWRGAVRDHLAEMRRVARSPSAGLFIPLDDSSDGARVLFQRSRSATSEIVEQAALARLGAAAGHALGAAGMALSVHLYLNGDIDTGEFVVGAAVDTLSLFGFMAWPVGAALMAPQVGKVVGSVAAGYALPYVMDETSMIGEWIRDAIGLPPPPRRGDPCNMAVSCDCGGIEAGILSGPWRQDCRRCEAALVEACRVALSRGVSADAAARAGGFCTGCSVYGPNFTPRPPR